MTANGSRVSEGASLQGSQVVRVYLRDGVTPSYSLWFEGVQYTPLYHGEDYDEFIIGDNGEVTILDAGLPYVSFSVEGVVVPADLARIRVACMRNDNSASVNQEGYVQKETNTDNCLNYAHLITEGWYFVSRLQGVSERPDIDELEYHNCIKHAQTGSGVYMGVSVEVVDPTLPAYLTYKGFIVYVFNYTN